MRLPADLLHTPTRAQRNVELNAGNVEEEWLLTFAGISIGYVGDARSVAVPGRSADICDRLMQPRSKVIPLCPQTGNQIRSTNSAGELRILQELSEDEVRCLQAAFV